jgi:hypothetical protein
VLIDSRPNAALGIEKFEKDISGGQADPKSSGVRVGDNLRFLGLHINLRIENLRSPTALRAHDEPSFRTYTHA